MFNISDTFQIICFNVPYLDIQECERRICFLYLRHVHDFLSRSFGEITSRLWICFRICVRVHIFRMHQAGMRVPNCIFGVVLIRDIKLAYISNWQSFPFTELTAAMTLGCDSVMLCMSFIERADREINR